MGFQKSKARRVLCAWAVIAGVVALPAFAQVALTVEQVSAIQSSLAAALQSAANKGSETVEAIIASSELSAVSLYGAGTASDVTAAVVATSEKASIDQCVIGRGLGKAAGTLATQNNLVGAKAVVSVLTNQGTAMERSCLKTALNDLGQPQLAALTDQSPVITGGTGATGGGFNGGGGFGGTNPGNNAGGCLNPSCTSL